VLSQCGIETLHFLSFTLHTDTHLGETLCFVQQTICFLSTHTKTRVKSHSGLEAILGRDPEQLVSVWVGSTQIKHDLCLPRGTVRLPIMLGWRFLRPIGSTQIKHDLCLPRGTARLPIMLGWRFLQPNDEGVKENLCCRFRGTKKFKIRKTDQTQVNREIP